VTGPVRGGVGGMDADGAAAGVCDWAGGEGCPAHAPMIDELATRSNRRGDITASLLKGEEPGYMSRIVKISR
jgi:hypothetical protein